MSKVLNLNLDYEMDKEREKAAEKPDGPQVPDNSVISRNIMENAYAINHPSMDAKIAREWRSVVKAMDEVIKSKKCFLILSDSDFSLLDAEVYKCKFPHQQAFIVPILLDELDMVKRRSKKEADEILKTIENSDKASEQVSKVLEMSKVKK